MPCGTVGLLTQYFVIVRNLFLMEITSDNGHGLRRSTQASRELEAPTTNASCRVGVSLFEISKQASRALEGPRLLNLKVNSWELKGLGQTSLHLSLPRASSGGKFPAHLDTPIMIWSTMMMIGWANRWKGEPEMKY